MMREFEIERQFDINIEVIKANKGVYYLKKTEKGNGYDGGGKEKACGQLSQARHGGVK